MLVAALSFASCGKDNPTPTPEPTPNPEPNPEPQPTELTFDVKVKEVTKANMYFEVTPSDLEAEYMVMVYDAEFVDGYSKDEYLVGDIYADLEIYANTLGLTLDEYFAKNIEKGAITDGSVSGLAVSSNYYLLVFGVDPANEYANTTEVTRVPFTTLDAPTLDVTFNVTATVEKNTVEFAVVPSDKEVFWHLISVEKEMLDYYTGPEVGMTVQNFYMDYVQSEIDQYASYGYSADEILSRIFLKGDQTLMATGLNAYTEYIYMVAGFVIDQDGIYLATDFEDGNYITEEPRYTGMTFEIQVTDIEKTRAAVKVIPSSNTDTYFWLIEEYDGVSTAEELMNANLQQWGAWMQMMAKYVGVQDFTGGPGSSYKYRFDCDDTEYYSLVFGYAGGVTSEPYMVTFKTLKGLEADEAEFNMVPTEVTSFGAEINVEVNDESVQYFIDLCLADQFNETEIINSTNTDLAAMYAETVAFDPNTTYANLFSQYFWRGNQTMKASGLIPNTEYMGYVVALDDKTGKVAKVHKFENLFSTPGDGTINPTMVNLGVFSGDEENGSIWGDASVTKGYAIAVIKAENFDGAKSLLYTSMEGDYAYEAAYSDGYLLANFGFEEMDMDSPYIFTLLSWGVDYTFAAYAVDQNNGSGKIGRLKVNANAKDKKPISDLEDLYNEASEKAEAFIPGSIVVDNNIDVPQVTITCVEAPEVEKESVAAPVQSVQPTVMILDYIKRHTFRD